MRRSKTFFRPGGGSLAALALFLALWSLLAFFFEDYIVPSLPEVLENAGTLWDARFLRHCGATLGRIAAGFSVSFALGTLIGLLAVSLGISAGAETFLLLFQVLPGLVVGVIFLLIFGVGSLAPVCLIVTLSTPFTAINTANSLMKKNRRLEGVIRAFNGRRRHLIRDLYLPALVPTAKTNATMGLVMAVKVVLLGEFIASQDGIGHLFNVAAVYFDMKAVFFYLLLVLAFIVCSQTLINVFFERCLARYLYPD